VLVIDDHYDTVEMFVEYLRSVGAIVVGVLSAKTAIAYAMTAGFDAVLVDLRMPGEDGRWFLRELRGSRAPSAQAPVFAVTGRHDQPATAEGFAASFLKPVDLDTIVATLAALPRVAH
jgi:DNA-binding response OmpR family regulator